LLKDRPVGQENIDCRVCEELQAQVEGRGSLSSANFSLVKVVLRHPASAPRAPHKAPQKTPRNVLHGSGLPASRTNNASRTALTRSPSPSRDISCRPLRSCFILAAALAKLPMTSPNGCCCATHLLHSTCTPTTHQASSLLHLLSLLMLQANTVSKAPAVPFHSSYTSVHVSSGRCANPAPLLTPR
jgi:hypothetical protein